MLYELCFLKDQGKIRDSDFEDSEEFVHLSVEEDLKLSSSVPVNMKEPSPKKLSNSPLAKKGMSLITAGRKKLLGGRFLR